MLVGLLQKSILLCQKHKRGYSTRGDFPSSLKGRNILSQKRWSCRGPICQTGNSGIVVNHFLTTTVAKWLEYSPREQEILGSIPSHDKPKSLKLVVVAFPLDIQDYGNSTMTGPPGSG